MRFEAENEIIKGKQVIVCNKKVGHPDHFHVTGQTHDDDIEQRRSRPFCLLPDLKEQLSRIWDVNCEPIPM